MIAGKGHETGQIIGGEVLPFDDAAVAREALAAPERHTRMTVSRPVVATMLSIWRYALSSAPIALARCRRELRAAARPARRRRQKHRRMLYLLLFPLSDQFSAFNVFRYITFRSGGAVVTSLLISFIFGPNLIAWLRSVQREGQPIRTDGPQSHLVRKKGRRRWAAS